MSRLAIVIVNYRSAALAIDCLRSLADTHAPGPPPSTVVVENCSPDDSLAQLRAAVTANGWSSWCRIEPADRNGGFAYGNNVGIRAAGAWLGSVPEFVLLLNPDTIVRADAVRHLLRFMDEHPGVGIAGSRLEDPDGTPQRSAFVFPTWLGELNEALRFGPASKMLSRWVVAPPVRDKPHRTDWVAGASMLIRRTVFDRVGLLDAAYFMYYEEVDFCLRAHRAGFECWYVPASRVVHLVGQSSGIVHGKPRRRPAYWFESRRRYFVRCFGLTHAALADIAFLLTFPVWRLRRALQRKPDTDPPKFWIDTLRNSVLLRGTSGMAEAQTDFEGSTSIAPPAPTTPGPRPGLRELLREDLAAHGSDRTRPGYRALRVYRFGVWRMGVKPKVLRAPLSVLYRWAYRRCRDRLGIELPYSAKIGRRVVFEHQHGIVVHGNSVIGDDCVLRQGVTLGNRRLDQPFDAPTLGNRVNVGAGAKILGKLTIGDDAVIGANAVVLTDVPAGHMAIGVPATVRPLASPRLSIAEDANEGAA
jgi:GT2 family glycosyltransferase/serine acetyltransferase